MVLADYLTGIYTYCFETFGSTGYVERNLIPSEHFIRF